MRMCLAPSLSWLNVPSASPPEMSSAAPFVIVSVALVAPSTRESMLPRRVTPPRKTKSPVKSG